MKIWLAVTFLLVLVLVEGRKNVQDKVFEDSAVGMEAFEAYDKMLSTFATDDGKDTKETTQFASGWQIGRENNSVANPTTSTFNESESEKMSEERQDFTGENGQFFLPVDDAYSVKDVYSQERLPRISQILSSGDAGSIDQLMEEANEDPFRILPFDMKYSDLIHADLYFGFATKMLMYFVFLSLVLPAMIPFVEIGIVVAEEIVLWTIGDI